MSRAAMQQALEALMMMRDKCEEYACPEYACPACDHADAAITTLRKALAEPEQGPEQQPVAHSVVEPLRPNEYQCRVSVKWVGRPVSGPLYTAPTTRKPLTDEEIIEHFEAEVDTGLLSSFADGVRFAERAHGIGEQA